MALPFFISVSKKIQAYLTGNNIIPRRDAGPGVWLTFLLPLAIVIGEVKHTGTTSHTYKTAASISFGFLIHTAIILLQANKNKFFSLSSLILPCLVSTGLLYYLAAEGIVLSIIFGVLVLLAYHVMILPVMKLCPRSFTFGEATIAVQGLLLFIVCCFVRNPIGANSCMDVSTVILQVGIICILGIGAASYHFNLKRKPKEFYSLFVFTITAILLPPLHFILGESPLLWIFTLILEDTVFLVVYWVLCCILAGVAIYITSTSTKKGTTVERKIFHILTVLVFAPGIILRPCFLYLASGVVFAILITLDMLRCLNMPPLGQLLQTAFIKLADEKDEGPLALTPIYLLAGCALPLWIHPDPERAELLPLIAGLLSVGLGDTAASACGTLVGKNKWPGGKKTKEGTAACFLSQLFLVIALIHFGYVPRTNLIKPFFAIALISIVEATTDQIDNIALPLLMYAMTL